MGVIDFWGPLGRPHGERATEAGVGGMKGSFQADKDHAFRRRTLLEAHGLVFLLQNDELG